MTSADLNFSYAIQRSSKRRSIAIVVDKAQVRVLIPARMSQAVAESFVRQKQAWICQKIALQERRLQQVAAKQFVNGESFLWLGQGYELCLTQGSTTTIALTEQTLDVQISRRVNADNHVPYLRDKLQRWFSTQALAFIQERVAHYSAVTGLVPQQIQMRSYKNKWGACTSRGEVLFNWRLLMAPSWVVDYVVVHELCHLRHMNHSSAFWQQVAQHYPNYRTARDWLKQHGHGLTWG